MWGHYYTYRYLEYFMGSKWIEEGNYDGGFLVGEASKTAQGVSRSRGIARFLGTVALGAGEVLHYDSATGTVVPYVSGTTGVANAISYANVTETDGTNAVQVTIISSDAVVNGEEIVFADAETASGKLLGISELATAGIKVAESQ